MMISILKSFQCLTLAISITSAF